MKIFRLLIFSILPALLLFGLIEGISHAHFSYSQISSRGYQGTPEVLNVGVSGWISDQ